MSVLAADYGFREAMATGDAPTVERSTVTLPNGTHTISVVVGGYYTGSTTATMPMRLKRLPPPPKRSRNHTLRALSG